MLPPGNGIAAEDIRRVTCTLAPFAARCLPYLRPKTVTEAQFSLPFAVACRLVYGGMTAELLSDSSLADPKLAAAMDKVVLDGVLEDQDDQAHLEAARVALELADGRTVTETLLTPTGDPRTPMTEADLDAKFLSASTGPGTGLSHRVAALCLAHVRDIETLPAAKELLAALHGL